MNEGSPAAIRTPATTTATMISTSVKPLRWNAFTLVRPPAPRRASSFFHTIGRNRCARGCGRLPQLAKWQWDTRGVRLDFWLQARCGPVQVALVEWGKPHGAGSQCGAAKRAEPLRRKGRIEETGALFTLEGFMARVCDICGQGGQDGQNISHAHNVTKR